MNNNYLIQISLILYNMWFDVTYIYIYLSRWWIFILIWDFVYQLLHQQHLSFVVKLGEVGEVRKHVYHLKNKQLKFWVQSMIAMRVQKIDTVLICECFYQQQNYRQIKKGENESLKVRLFGLLRNIAKMIIIL